MSLCAGHLQQLEVTLRDAALFEPGSIICVQIRPVLLEHLRHAGHHVQAHGSARRIGERREKRGLHRGIGELCSPSFTYVVSGIPVEVTDDAVSNETSTIRVLLPVRAISRHKELQTVHEAEAIEATGHEVRRDIRKRGNESLSKFARHLKVAPTGHEVCHPVSIDLDLRGHAAQDIPDVVDCCTKQALMIRILLQKIDLADSPLRLRRNVVRHAL